MMVYRAGLLTITYVPKEQTLLLNKHLLTLEQADEICEWVRFTQSELSNAFHGSSGDSELIVDTQLHGVTLRVNSCWYTEPWVVEIDGCKLGIADADFVLNLHMYSSVDGSKFMVFAKKYKVEEVIVKASRSKKPDSPYNSIEDLF